MELTSPEVHEVHAGIHISFPDLILHLLWGKKKAMKKKQKKPVCVCMRVYACVCVCMCMYACACVCMRVCLCVYVHQEVPHWLQGAKGRRASEKRRERSVKFGDA